MYELHACLLGGRSGGLIAVVLTSFGLSLDIACAWNATDGGNPPASVQRNDVV